jgi:hypothetical protein
MPRVGFEPTVPVSARSKTVHDLDRSASVTGYLQFTYTILLGAVTTNVKMMRKLSGYTYI